MKSKAPPKPAIQLTEEEKLRDKRIEKTLENATGGYSVKTVENLCHCSEVQALASLRRLVADEKAETRPSRSKDTLYGIKRPKTDEKLFS